MDTSFFSWSIADLWDWLAHIPALGFVIVVALAVVLVVRLIGMAK